MGFAISWDDVSERLYETGLDRGVLYPQNADGSYAKGENQNGLTSVDESPSGGEANDIYADNIKYLSLMSNEEFGATINAYTFPEGFYPCDGMAKLSNGLIVAQQTRKPFGLSYRTKVGNDTEGDEHGYIIHLIYNAKVQPSQKTRSTTNDSPEATEMSWEMKTTPVAINGTNPDTGKAFRPTSHLQISTLTTDSSKITALENKLYGNAGTATFTAVVSSSGNPVEKGYYEKTGSATPDVPSNYNLSADTTVDGTKTYYEKTVSGNTDPELPTPDEVIALLSGQG